MPSSCVILGTDYMSSTLFSVYMYCVYVDIELYLLMTCIHFYLNKSIYLSRYTLLSSKLRTCWNYTFTDNVIIFFRRSIVKTEIKCLDKGLKCMSIFTRSLYRRKQKKKTKYFTKHFFFIRNRTCPYHKVTLWFVSTEYDKMSCINKKQLECICIWKKIRMSSCRKKRNTCTFLYDEILNLL